jgi:hypothetical protein
VRGTGDLIFIYPFLSLSLSFFHVFILYFMQQHFHHVLQINRPIASFVFAGPTGVGKSELAKTLAAYYFGSEEAMVRAEKALFYVYVLFWTRKLQGAADGFTSLDREHLAVHCTALSPLILFFSPYILSLTPPTPPPPSVGPAGHVRVHGAPHGLQTDRVPARVSAHSAPLSFFPSFFLRAPPLAYTVIFFFFCSIT